MELLLAAVHKLDTGASEPLTITYRNREVLHNFGSVCVAGAKTKPVITVYLLGFLRVKTSTYVDAYNLGNGYRNALNFH